MIHVPSLKVSSLHMRPSLQVTDSQVQALIQDSVTEQVCEHERYFLQVWQYLRYQTEVALEAQEQILPNIHLSYRSVLTSACSLLFIDAQMSLKAPSRTTSSFVFIIESEASPVRAAPTTSEETLPSSCNVLLMPRPLICLRLSTFWYTRRLVRKG